jgi:hypothetical protein
MPDPTTDPPYQTLKCPECGNTEDFAETALRDTYQAFTVVSGGEPEWDLFETGEESIPLVVACMACKDGDGVVVWKRTAPIAVEDLT